MSGRWLDSLAILLAELCVTVCVIYGAIGVALLIAEGLKYAGWI